jgi:hypothetical protein
VEQRAHEISWESTGGVPLRLIRAENQPRTSTLIFAHDDGSEGAAQSVFYKAFQNSEFSPARMDVRGTGISATPGDVPQTAFLAPLLMGKQSNLARLVLTQGRTLVGMRAADLLQASRLLPQLQDSPPVSLVAEGGMGLCAMAAAYLRPEAFHRLILVQTVISWTALATGPGRVSTFADYLYGVLNHFDTPDLTQTLPAGKVLWVNPTDAPGKVISLDHAREIHSGEAVKFVFATTPFDFVEAVERFLSAH